MPSGGTVLAGPGNNLFGSTRHTICDKMAIAPQMNSGSEEAAEPLAGLETGFTPVESRARRFCGALLRSRTAYAGIWPRVGLLFAALCLVKLILLVDFRKHLFESHWRISGLPHTWVNEAAFWVFAVVVGLHLWRLGTHCMAAGRRAVRVANVWVLILGAAFILLTFHEGSTNYLAPVMNGVLTWKNLGWYLALDFCFRPPYLAVWIFVYALAYYSLARSGLEPLILRFTAVCAVAYIALCLRDFTKYHNALLAVDGVGVACLMTSWRPRRALGLVWIGLFLLGVGFFFGLFYGLSPKLTLAGLDPEFAVLAGTSLVLLAGASLFAWRFGFFSGWSWTLPFALAVFLLLINFNYGWSLTYNKLLCEGIALPRYFLGEFVVAALLFLSAMAYRQWRPAGSLWWLDVCNLLLITLALADLRLAQIMATRLDWPALSLAVGETPRMMWRLARPYLPALLLALLIVGALYAALSWALQRADQQPSFRDRPQAFAGARFFLLSFVLLGLVGERLIDRDKAQGQSALLLAETSPLWRRTVDPPMDRRAFVETAQVLGMDQLVAPGPVSQRAPRDLNVVLILQESTYNKYLSLFGAAEDTQPLLSRYRDRMEVFPNFFMSFAGSIQARFAAFTGLYPVPDYRSFTQERVGVKSIFELLHDRGYTSSLFYSSFFDYTSFRDLLKGRKVDELYDADTMPGERKAEPVAWGLREEETLEAMQAQIRRYAAGQQKFFLTYIPAAPHYPYDATSARFIRFKKGVMGDYTPLYLNELLFMDWIVSSMVDQLKDSGLLDKTVVIITSDHGELLGADNGPIGHGWAVTPELANIPLIVMDPDHLGHHINYTVGSQVDLTPTILDLLGIKTPNDELWQGTSLYSTDAKSNRTIYINSLRQYGIVKGDRIFCGDRETGAAGGVRNVFSITNQDSRTTFVAAGWTNSPAPAISVFDQFQVSFLRHYSRYCEDMRQPPAGK